MERQFKQAKLAIAARPRAATTAAERQSRALDEALLETFPASDPVSVVSD